MIVEKLYLTEEETEATGEVETDGVSDTEIHPVDQYVDFDKDDTEIKSQLIKFIRDNLKFTDAANLLQKFSSKFVGYFAECAGKNMLSNVKNVFMNYINNPAATDALTSEDAFTKAYNFLQSSKELNTDEGLKWINTGDPNKCILYLPELFKNVSDDEKIGQIVDLDFQWAQNLGSLGESLVLEANAYEKRKYGNDPQKALLKRAEREKNRSKGKDEIDKEARERKERAKLKLSAKKEQEKRKERAERKKASEEEIAKDKQDREERAKQKLAAKKEAEAKEKAKWNTKISTMQKMSQLRTAVKGRSIDDFLRNFDSRAGFSNRDTQTSNFTKWAKSNPEKAVASLVNTGKYTKDAATEIVKALQQTV